MTTFILDCDDVLLDWLGGFRAWSIKAGYQPLAEEPWDWSMAKWIGVDSDTASRLIRDFNNSREFGELEPVPDAVRVVTRLRERGHEAIVVSSYRTGDPGCDKRRRLCINKHFPDIQICSLYLTQNKRHIYDRIPAGAISIDDNVPHAHDAHDAGHDSFVFGRGHNRHLQERHGRYLTWIDSWADFESRFMGESCTKRYSAYARSPGAHELRPIGEFDDLIMGQHACTVCDPEGFHVFDSGMVIDRVTHRRLNWSATASPFGEIRWA